jgi:dTDP-4-amino-4,6-dideoxygalactose transaminase
MLKVADGGVKRAPAGPPVPVLDLKAQYATLRDELARVVREVMDSTTYILGPKVAAFE